MFDTTDSVPRSEGKVRPFAALKRLARKMNVEIKFSSRPWKPLLPSPKPGDMQEAYDPGNEFLTSPEGRRIRKAVIYKKPAVAKRSKEVENGVFVGKPQVTYKVLRPLKEGQSQPYSTPKGKAWTSVDAKEIQRGEHFKEQPVFERHRLDWNKLVHAHVENQIEPERQQLKLAGITEPSEHTRARLRRDLRQKFLLQTQELYAGERMGKKQLAAAVQRHAEGMMKRDRDYMAGGLRQSRAIIHARKADPLEARAHPDRMIEYKKRLETLTPPRQAETKTTRGFLQDKLNEIAHRGSSLIAEEQDALWAAKRDKLHLHRQMVASPEYAKRFPDPAVHQAKVAEADEALQEHFNSRRTKAEIREQSVGTVGTLADKPVSHGGTALSKESAETIANILERGNKSGKPITVAHVHRLKAHFDDLYERSAPSGIAGVQKELLHRGDVFRKPLTVAKVGYPHLGKLGVGLGIAGSVAAGLAVRHIVKKRQERQLARRGRLIQFANKFGDLPEEAKRILESSINKASMQNWRDAERAIPNIVRSKRLRRRQALVKLKRKWGEGFLQKVLSHPELPTHPNAPNWRQMFEHQRDENVLLRRQQVTHAHIRAEALKDQEEILGTQAKEQSKKEYSRGIGTGREQARASAQAHYEQKANELTGTLHAESDKRANRLKWIAAGTGLAGGVAGYGLGRHDKQAHQRHDALQAIAYTRELRRPKATPKPQQPTITIGISGVDGKRRNVQFSAMDNIKHKLMGSESHESSPGHDIAIGAIEGGLTFPASAWAAKRLLGPNPSLGRKMLVGGVVGGAATGLVGIGLAHVLRGTKQLKRQKQQRSEMSSKSKLHQFTAQRTLVARDRYSKMIHEHDVDRANTYYAHTAALGAGIGLLARKKMPLSKAALLGAGVGLGTQKLARMYSAATKDAFGDRSVEGKRVDRTPEIVGTAALGLYGLKRLRGLKAPKFFSSTSPVIRLASRDDDLDPQEGPEWLQKWAHKKLYGREYSTLGQATKIKKYAGRTHRIVRDLNYKRQGLPNIDDRGRLRKNEWEKPWVAGALTTAALAGTIFGGKKAIDFLKAAHPQSRIGQLKERFLQGNVPGLKSKGLAKVVETYHNIVDDTKRWRDKPLHVEGKYERSKFDQVTGKKKSAKQIEREANQASNLDLFKNIAARRTIHPWEKGAGEKGFSSNILSCIHLCQNDFLNWSKLEAR